MYQNLGEVCQLEFTGTKDRKIIKLCNCCAVIPSSGILEENFEWKGLAFTALCFHFAGGFFSGVLHVQVA